MQWYGSALQTDGAKLLIDLTAGREDILNSDCAQGEGVSQAVIGWKEGSSLWSLNSWIFACDLRSTGRVYFFGLVTEQNDV